MRTNLPGLKYRTSRVICMSMVAKLHYHCYGTSQAIFGVPLCKVILTTFHGVISSYNFKVIT